MEKNLAVSQYLQKLSTKVDSEHLQVLQQKYAAPQIKDLADAELLAKTAECLLHIHVITGWSLPDDKSYIKVLTEQLFQKLKEDFYMLNFSEIYFAFRKAVGKQDWGKNTNLELICAVLSSYCFDRSIVSFEEEKINSKPEQRIYSDEEILNQRRAEIEKAFQAMKRGHYPIIHIYFESILVKDGFMEEGVTAAEFFVYALGMSYEHLYVKEMEQE